MRFVMEFNVTIQLDRLHCRSEYDESGGSEPYLWPAFARVDASTLPFVGRRVEFTVPLEASTARSALGGAGKNVRRGAVIPIPEVLGRYTSNILAMNYLGNNTALVGFALALLEDDGSRTAAISAGHQAYADGLRSEVNRFVDANARPPNTNELLAIRTEVARQTEAAIRANLPWHACFSTQDRLIGSLGSDDTLFPFSRLLELADQGSQQFEMPIIGRQTVRYYQPIIKTVVYTHHYDLQWHIQVQGVPLEQLPETEGILLDQVERAGQRLLELDAILAGAVEGQGPQARGQGRIENVRVMRSQLVNELASVWEAFVALRHGKTLEANLD